MRALQPQKKLYRPRGLHRYIMGSRLERQNVYVRNNAFDDWLIATTASLIQDEAETYLRQLEWACMDGTLS